MTDQHDSDLCRRCSHQKGSHVLQWENDFPYVFCSSCGGDCASEDDI